MNTLFYFIGANISYYWTNDLKGAQKNKKLLIIKKSDLTVYQGVSIKINTQLGKARLKTAL